MSETFEPSAESSDFYSRLGMIEIARYRFRAFEAKFHRQPGPQEPIFFDEFNDHPVKANLDTIRRQLAEAACASKLRLDPILRFLGLAPTPARQNRRTRQVPQPVKSRRPRTQGTGSRRIGMGVPSPWKRFLADHRLHRRHAISSKELKVLSNVSFLGHAQTVKDCLSILKLIRKAGDQQV